MGCSKYLQDVAGCTQHCMHRIAHLTLELAAIHSVIRVQLANGRLHGWRRLSHRRRCTASDLDLPRWMNFTLGLSLSTQRKPNRLLKFQRCECSSRPVLFRGRCAASAMVQDRIEKRLGASDLRRRPLPGHIRRLGFGPQGGHAIPPDRAGPARH